MKLNYTSILATVVAVCAMTFTSCKTSQPLSYFQNADSVSTVDASLDYALRLHTADELIITVNSPVPEATAAFNLPATNPATAGNIEISTAAQNQTYVIDSEGYISFPIFGKIHAEGLTTSQLRDLIAEKVAKYSDDATVRVQLANFRVNVLGEVRNPGSVEVKTERFSVLDALAAAGDMTQYGVRNEVMLIREENGKRSYHTLNLEDAAIVNSPYFFLSQNDVIYVKPNKVSESNARYDTNNSYRISVVSTVVSMVSVIASLVIALTVK